MRASLLHWTLMRQVKARAQQERRTLPEMLHRLVAYGLKTLPLEVVSPEERARKVARNRARARAPIAHNTVFGEEE